MKKIATTLLSIMLLVCLVGCNNATKPSIEDYIWRMRTVMSNDIELADSEDIVLAVGEPDELYPNAKLVELTLVAKNSRIMITDATNNKTYEGTYKVSGKNPKGTDYEVTIDGKHGYATVAMTKYYDDMEEPTLPINLGDYSIYFYGEAFEE